MWIELEVLTPTHLGSGGDLTPMEYWIEDELLRIHLDSLFSDPGFLPYQEVFIREAAKTRYIAQYLPPSLLSRHIRYKLKMSPGARQHLVTNQVIIKEFIKSAGRVFIPGSSIKGSILSALIFDALKELCKEQGMQRRIEGLLQDLRNRRSYTELLDIAIGSIKDPRSTAGKADRFFSWLKVSDTNLSEPRQTLEIYYSQVVGAKKGGSLPILFEGLAPEAKWNLSLVAPSESRYREERVLECIDTFYRMVWERSANGLKAPGGGYLMRLGHGSSAWSTSLLLFAESLGVKGYPLRVPHTRKLVDAKIPMGWVILRPTDESKGRASFFRVAGAESVPASSHGANLSKEREAQPEKVPGPASSGSQKDQETPGKTRIEPHQTPMLPGKVTAKSLMYQASLWNPRDRFMLERIIKDLDNISEEEAAGIALNLKEKLKKAGLWVKHPMRFDIEVFLEESNG